MKHTIRQLSIGITALLLVADLAGTTLIGAVQDAAAPAKDAPKPESADTVQQNAPTRDKTGQKEKSGWGKFVSFKDGTLTLKDNAGESVWNNITEKTKIAHWDDAAHKYGPSGTVEALSKVEAGTWVFVAENKTRVHVGAAKESHVTGAFVSFKNDRLLMLGKDLGNYAQKKGTEIHFKKFAENVPVYESIDGGDYKLAGIAETILPNVKEGTSITVYGEGDDNFTRIEIGVPKKKTLL